MREAAKRCLAFTFAFELATERPGELEQERRRRAPFGHAEKRPPWQRGLMAGRKVTASLFPSIAAGSTE